MKNLSNPGRITLLLLAACLLPASAAWAQLSYNFSAGPNFTTMDVGNIRNLRNPEYDVKVGFYANLGIGMNVGPVSVHSGASYVKAGAIFDGSEFLERGNFDVNFVNVPVDLRIAIPVGPMIEPYLLGGAERRFRLDLAEDDISFEDNLKTQSTAASIGAGVTLTIPGFGMRISPELRYAVDIDGLTKGEITVGDELVRIRDEFKANMLRFGLVFGL